MSGQDVDLSIATRSRIAAGAAEIPLYRHVHPYIGKTAQSHLMYENVPHKSVVPAIASGFKTGSFAPEKNAMYRDRPDT